MAQPLRVALACALSLSAGACGGLGLSDYPDAIHAWRSGQRDQALELARASYEKFRRDNGLAEAEIGQATEAALATLEDELVVPAGGVDPAVGPETLDGDSSTLMARVRADLLSGRATPTMRAILNVSALGLSTHAQGLLSVVFRREPIEADGGVLSDHSVALRSLVTKRAALDALGRLK